MNKNILIVSGSDYTYQVYQALIDIKKLGCKLYLLSDGYFNPREGIYEKVLISNLRNTKETIEYVKSQNIKFDAITIKTSEWLTPLTALLAKEYGCIGNDPEVAFICRSKYHMRMAMQKAGIPVPKFKLCRNISEIKCGIKEIGIPCILKPIGGNASYGTFAIYNENDLLDLQKNYDNSVKYLKEKALSEDMFTFNQDELNLMGIDNFFDTTTDYLVEEFIFGHTHLSIDSITQNGKTTIFGIAHQVRMKSPYFIQLSEIQPFICDNYLKKEIEDLTIKTINVVGIKNSCSHTEILLTEKGPRVIEIACRIGGDNIHDAIFQTTGYNMMYESIMIALGIDRKYKIENKCFTAMQYFLPEKAGIIKDIHIPNILKDDNNITEIEFSFKTGDKVDIPPNSFDFIGYLCAKGKTPEEAQKNLKNASDNIFINIS